MQVGDIVLSVATLQDDSGTKLPRTLIRVGQWLKEKWLGSSGGKGLPVVHAAIAVGNNIVIESVGAGILATDLTQEKPPRSAVIYASDKPWLGINAATIASQFYADREANSIVGKYSLKKAMASIISAGKGSNDLMQRITESVSIGDTSFCSQFVVNCYEAGNLSARDNLNTPPPRIFNQKPSAMTPDELWKFCEGPKNGFKFAGFWQDGVQHYDV